MNITEYGKEIRKWRLDNGVGFTKFTEAVCLSKSTVSGMERSSDKLTKTSFQRVMASINFNNRDRARLYDAYWLTKHPEYWDEDDSIEDRYIIASILRRVRNKEISLKDLVWEGWKYV